MRVILLRMIMKIFYFHVFLSPELQCLIIEVELLLLKFGTLNPDVVNPGIHLEMRPLMPLFYFQRLTSEWFIKEAEGIADDIFTATGNGDILTKKYLKLSVTC